MANYAVVADQAIGDFYNLPVIAEHDTADYDFWLQRIAGKLALWQRIDPQLKPFALDFAQGKGAYRLQQVKSQREPLARACGLTKGRRPQITDATSGLAQDGLLLAAIGAEVTLLEQHPLVHALVADALHRAAQGPAWLTTIVSRVEHHYCNASTWLNEHSAEVIYLDPMYPKQGHQRTAKVKKGMQLLRLLPDTETDHSQLFTDAQQAYQSRLVVKRPNWATPLGSTAVSQCYQTKCGLCTSIVCFYNKPTVSKHKVLRGSGVLQA